MVIMVEVVKNLAWVYRVGREREFDRTKESITDWLTYFPMGLNKIRSCDSTFFNLSVIFQQV